MAVCYCDYDSGMPKFYFVEIRRARKLHKCSECFKDIAAGESYEHVRGKWDGEVGTLKTCPSCLALREYTKAHVPCVCWSHGTMVENCMETLREYEDQCPGIVFGALRAIVKARQAQRARRGT